MDVSRADSIIGDDDEGELVFSGDVKEPSVIKAFVEHAGDVNYEPIPEEGKCFTGWITWRGGAHARASSTLGTLLRS